MFCIITRWVQQQKERRNSTQIRQLRTRKSEDAIFFFLFLFFFFFLLLQGGLEQFKQGKAHRTPLNFILHTHTVLHACYVVMEIINDCVIKKGNSSRGCSFSWGLLLSSFFFLSLRAQLINRLSACAECVEQVFSRSLFRYARALCAFSSFFLSRPQKLSKFNFRVS